MDELMVSIIEDIKNLPLDGVIRKWGGVSIQIPIFRGEVRKRAIIESYSNMEATLSQKNKYIILSMEFNVSQKYIKKIISAHKRNDDHNDHSDHNP